MAASDSVAVHLQSPAVTAGPSPAQPAPFLTHSSAALPHAEKEPSFRPVVDHFDSRSVHSTRTSARSIHSVRMARSVRSRASKQSNLTHSEPHFSGAEIVRDIIVGLSDGLTVPFALAAGLASLNNSKIVVTAGMSEIVAGAISMGLGGYLAGMSEIEHYDAERARERMEVDVMPEEEEQEIVDIFHPYGLDRESIEPLLSLLKANPETWVDFMMRFELSLERPSVHRSWISAITIGLSYFVSG
ncbi:hypothetical protein HK405_010842 [Cladochytrium tenue]|nr:hypothetical protein HK405_010842 [Cladochytrium tenue]